MEHAEDSFEAIGAWVAELREARGLRSQSALAREIHVCAPMVNKVERGVTLSEQTAELLDAYLETGGAISARRRRVKPTPPGQPQPGEAAEGGDATDRREFGIAVAATAAGDIFQRINAGSLDLLTVDRLHTSVNEIAKMYTVLPHRDLSQRIVSVWEQAERRLERRMPGGARRDLTLIAGQLGYYAGRLAFNVGDDESALQFAALAHQHGQDSGDPLLQGASACLRSSLAHYAGRHIAAAEIAAQAKAERPPIHERPARGLRSASVGSGRAGRKGARCPHRNGRACVDRQRHGRV